MTVQLQRPLLVGGIGLTLGLWGLDSISHSLAGVGDWLTLGTLAAGGGYWWQSARYEARTSIVRASQDRSTHTRSSLESSPTGHRSTEDRKSRIYPNRLIRATINSSSDQFNPSDRHVAITGGHRVGKSSLMKLLATQPVPSPTPLKYIETPALFTSGAQSATLSATAERVAQAADLVLFVTNGDLTASEYKYLTALHQAHQRVILLFNQADRYLPDERHLILQKLQATVTGTLAASEVVATSTAPAPIQVRQIQADGSTISSQEIPPADIASLESQLTQILATEGEKLLWANTYRQIAGVRVAAKTALDRVRRDRSLPLIDQNQWIVAAAAFANPVPALDLLATAAVNAQMVIDLGAIYQQKFSLEQAQAAAGAMGNVMLKLGLVELCTQTVASVLKTNAITFVAGGLVQGLSAAYLTRIAGLTLVEYLEAQDLVTPEPARAWNLDLLSNTLQKVFQANQRVAYVQTVVKQGIERLVPEQATV